MTIASPGRTPAIKPQPEDLIREARRRQRRRQLLIGLVEFGSTGGRCR